MSSTSPVVGRCPIEPIGADFDQHDPAFGPRAYEVLDASRETDRVSRSEVYGGFWVVTRHEDAKAVVHNPTVFSNREGVVYPYAPGGNEDMIPVAVDPPELNGFRKLLTPLFSGKAVGARITVTREITNHLIDQFVESGRVEFFEEFTSPLAAIVTLRFLGLGAADWEDYTRVSHMMTEKGFLTRLPQADREQFTVEFLSGLEQFHAAALVKIKQAEALPVEERGNSIIDKITGAEIDGQVLTYETLSHIVNTIFRAGFDTTAMTLGTMLARLGQDQQLQHLLRTEPARIDDFIEESLRIQSPTTFMLKVATEDIELGGAQIKQGDAVLVSWAAANRDPREFERPTEFDIDRSPNRHSSFGLGVHRCVGSHLARTTMRIGIQEILRRLPEFTVAPEGIVHSEDCGIVFGYRRVHATFPAGARENSYPADVLTGPW